MDYIHDVIFFTNIQCLINSNTIIIKRINKMFNNKTNRGVMSKPCQVYFLVTLHLNFISNSINNFTFFD